MLIAMTVFALIFGFGGQVAGFCSWLATNLAVAFLGGLLAGCVLHDCDRARVFGGGAIANIALSWRLGWAGGATRGAINTMDYLLPPSVDPEMIEALIISLASPCTLAASMALGGFVALRAAPHWHRWATSETPREK